jgi:HEAT repeat protein
MKKRLIVSGIMIAIGLALEIAVVSIWPRHGWRSWSLNDPDPAVRAQAGRTMDRDGNEAALIAQLKDNNPDVRLLAAQKLGSDYSDAGSKQAERAWALITMLDDEHASVRREAAWSLSHLGPQAWPALEKALNDDDSRVCRGALLALQFAHSWKDYPDFLPSTSTADIADILAKLLKSKDEEVRCDAEETLEYYQRR